MTPIQLEQVREQTSFEPLYSNSAANFRDYKFDFSSKRRVRVVTTWGMHLFLLLFLLIGGAILTIGIVRKEGFPIYGGIVFMLVPMLFCFRNRIVFDLLSGSFSYGKRRVGFSQIAALQVIKKSCSKNRGVDFLAWELNLVLEDGSRINILNHGNYKAFAQDASRLADAMNLKVWSQSGLWSPEDDMDQEQRKSNLQEGLSLGGLLFGLFFLGIPLTGLFLQLILPLAQNCFSKNWVECPAVVTMSKVVNVSDNRSRSNSYRIQISADYQWEDHLFTCKRFDFFHSGVFSNNGGKELLQIVESLPPGTQTYCLVNPNHPEHSVMRRQWPSWPIIKSSLFLLVFIAAGGFFAFLSVKGVLKKHLQNSNAVCTQIKSIKH